MDNKEIRELIECIEANKHDIKIRVRSVVLDPIDKINLPDAATESYFKEVGHQNSQIEKQARDIMLFFAEKWRNSNDPEDIQLSSLYENLKKIIDLIIPQIKEIVSYYSYCADNKHFFCSSDSGKEALELMLKACSHCNSIYESLHRLGEEGTKREDKVVFFNLLEMLQEGLDDINATIKYEKEWESSTIKVNLDPDLFLNHVLINIKNNINNRAFGTSIYRNKYLWDKKVLIAITEDNYSYFVTISNNGAPFKGDISRIFEYGYCHGEMKHSGIGMASIKKYMIKMGGDADFYISSNPNYTTTYKLTIKK